MKVYHWKSQLKQQKLNHQKLNHQEMILNKIFQQPHRRNLHLLNIHHLKVKRFKMIQVINWILKLKVGEQTTNIALWVVCRINRWLTFVAVCNQF